MKIPIHFNKWHHTHFKAKQRSLSQIVFNLVIIVIFYKNTENKYGKNQEYLK